MDIEDRIDIIEITKKESGFLERTGINHFPLFHQ